MPLTQIPFELEKQLTLSLQFKQIEKRITKIPVPIQLAIRQVERYLNDTTELIERDRWLNLSQLLSRKVQDKL
jgi:hypothetical protein